jgi:hypothetical protein
MDFRYKRPVITPCQIYKGLVPDESKQINVLIQIKNDNKSEDCWETCKHFGVKALRIYMGSEKMVAVWVPTQVSASLSLRLERSRRRRPTVKRREKLYITAEFYFTIFVIPNMESL